MKRKPSFQLALLACLLFSIPFISNAQIKLSKLFSDGVVLQRDMEVPIWGWAASGDNIEVIFNGKTFQTRSDASGKWMVRLDPMPAGGPYEIHVNGSENNFHIKDVLFGDVWVCSGQSNMEWSVRQSGNPEEEIANADDAKIRHFKVPLTWADKPAEELAGGTWKVCNSENVADFTAVGYYFARELRKHVDVPIGLLNSSWGGSRIEPWMSQEALGLENVDDFLEELEQRAKARFEKQIEALKSKLGYVPTGEDKGMADGKVLWANPNMDDSKWTFMTLPVLWEDAGYANVDGIAWFRTSFELSADDLGKELELHLGPIDDSDQTWVNGQLVGEMTMKYSAPRIYTIANTQVRAGINNITVRVEDTGGGGGIWGKPEQLFVKVGDRKISLAKDWRFKLGAVKSYSFFARNQIPVILYNKMIHPMLDFPIKGALWYQGESNAKEVDAHEYRDLFPKMITDWRSRWNCGNFPFLFVQLANFMQADELPSESMWAVLRESQSETLKVPNTAQAVIIDIGEADDIHPKNKQDVGLRLSLGARKLAYNEDIVYSGPTYKNHHIENGKIVLEFNHIGSGLMAKDKYGYLKGFAIAGENQEFQWAKAEIQGNRVVVWNDDLGKPVAVRYAWGNNPADANLYNEEGLPASPFRTDEW